MLFAQVLRIRPITTLYSSYRCYTAIATDATVCTLIWHLKITRHMQQGTALLAAHAKLCCSRYTGQCALSVAAPQSQCTTALLMRHVYTCAHYSTMTHKSRIFCSVLERKKTDRQNQTEQARFALGLAFPLSL